MSVPKRVESAIDAMAAHDYESALFQICTAIDTTATREAGVLRGTRRTYKDFVHDNMNVITGTGVGKYILNVNIEYDNPDVPKEPNGLCSFQSIIYHAVRCGLYHNAAIPMDIEFVTPSIFSRKNNKVQIPSAMIYGLIVSVVVSPANAKELVAERYGLDVRGFQLPINSLWGRRTELLNLYEAMNAFPAPMPLPPGSTGATP